MKTICFFNSVSSWGGGEKWFFDTAIKFAAKAYRVILFADPGGMLYKKTEETKTQVVTLIGIEVSNLSFLNYSKIQQLKKKLLALKLDIIIINQPKDLKLAGIAAKKARVKRIIYRRGSAIPVKNNPLNKYIFSKVITDILANSEATKNSILQRNNKLFDADKIKVIYNPIDTNEFLNRRYDCIYNKKEQEIVIGNVGRLVEQKNQQFLIDLSVMLQLKNIPHTILIGGSGKLEKKLKVYANEKNVSANIIFCGFVENVKDLLMSCDIFILASLWEGFGYVLAEAALCKKPSIAFNLSSNPELVIDNETGFLIPPNNIQACYEKVALFYKNQDLQKRFGELAFERAINKFDENIIMQQLEKFFQTEL